MLLRSETTKPYPLMAINQYPTFSYKSSLLEHSSPKRPKYEKNCPSQTPYFLKSYFVNSFYLLLKTLASQSKCLQKRRFCEFIPLDMNETFSFYHFQIPQGIPFSKNMVSGLGNFFRILAVSGNRVTVTWYCIRFLIPLIRQTFNTPKCEEKSIHDHS